MRVTSVWCPVRQAYVIRVMDLEGQVIKVLCSEFDKAPRTCRMKKEAFEGGPLSQLLKHVSEDSLADPMVSCRIG